MRTLHLISHTHWDREWYRTFQQFRLRLVRLVDGLLELFEREPDYRHFMLDGQLIALEDYLEVRPEQAQTIRRWVQSGRLLIGPWYILPDEFLVSPEATIRNLLAGERLTRPYGAVMRIGYLPDTFGHIGQMPQILRGFGLETAAVMRGLGDEPCEFWWQSPDGSRVLMAYLRDSYSNAAGLPSGRPEALAAEVARLRDALVPFSAGPNLLLMHGTDHMEPVPGTSADVASLAGRLDGDRMIHSTLPDYFASLWSSLLLETLPVVTGELRECRRHSLLPGVLSTRMWIKQRNMACEHLLERWAEPMTTFAGWLLGDAAEAEMIRQPQAALRQAWRLLMQCHPHDSICGCSIDLVHEEMRPRFDQVEQVGEELTRQALSALANGMDSNAVAPDGALTAVVVFNPGSAERTDLVSVTVEGLPAGPLELVDEEGTALPFQTEGLGASYVAEFLLDRAGFRALFAQAGDGVVMGQRIQAFETHREGSTLVIEAGVSEERPPNLPVWERGKQVVEASLEDETVMQYAVRARSTEATRLVFSAPRVPACGYRTFWIRSLPPAPQKTFRLNPLVRAMIPLAMCVSAHPLGQRLLARLAPPTESRPPFRIENEFLVVEALADGTIVLLDRRSGARWEGLNRFIDGGDRGDTYNYSPPATDRLVTARRKAVRVMRGAVVSTMEIELELDVPRGLSAGRAARSQETARIPVRAQVRLARGVPMVSFHTEVENTASDHRLRVHFPTGLKVETADYDGHFEIVRRKIDVPPGSADWIEQPRPEAPMRAFVDVHDANQGLLLAARGLPEVEVLQQPDGSAESALTLLRCVGWLSRDDFPERKGHAGPFLPTPGAQMPGVWSFDYALVPHDACETTGAYHLGYAFQTPLRAAQSLAQRGTGLPTSGSFMRVHPSEFAISAVKAAEDGSGWLVRGYNLSDHPLEVTLELLRPVRGASLASLSEEVLRPLGSRDGRIFAFTAEPHAVVSVRFE